MDFTRDFDSAMWQDRLRGVDLVINAVGILVERNGQDFESLHIRAPRALFAACVAMGIKIINISALGADDQAQSQYHLTKKAADDSLLSLDPAALIVQPSLVFGEDGASARIFTMLASLPIIPLPGAGGQRIQPIHIDDLTSALVALVAEHGRWAGRRIPLVGPMPVTFRAFLAQLRTAMGMSNPRFLPVPAPVIHVLTGVARLFRSKMMNPEVWQMLERGNTAESSSTRVILGREPRAVSELIPPLRQQSLRTTAKLGWLVPLVRWSVMVVWLVAGVVSLGLYPVADSLSLLARTGVPTLWAPTLLYSAAAIDIGLGLATLMLRRRRLLWIIQAGIIISYTAIITVWLPEYWLHPYGPVVKNIPLLAAIYVLYETEQV